jgi:dTMP kinase
MGEPMQRRMRAGFLDLAHEFAERIRVIDGARPPEAVAADVLRIARSAPGLRP